MKLTLWSTAASAMGLNWWFLCSFESRHTRHTSCWSSWQNSLSLSPWRLQSAPLWPLSCKNVSHRFLNARLVGGSSLDDLLLRLDILWILWFPSTAADRLYRSCDYMTEQLGPWRCQCTQDKIYPPLASKPFSKSKYKSGASFPLVVTFPPNFTFTFRSLKNPVSFWVLLLF